jgi:tRNA-2-methylthio-N6-dimethylallyladenosine synthase
MPTERPRTFHIVTFGCQMNMADSSTLASALLTRGLNRVDREEEADLIVVNTCSVREKAEQRAIGRLNEMQRYKRERPHVRLAVVGCMAQRLKDKLVEDLPHVDYVLGTDRQFELPDVIEGIEGTSRVMTAFGHEEIDRLAPIKENSYSAFVTISRGCSNYCTYCIVPYVRGVERAHDPDLIVGSINGLVDEGVVEITLLGQNVNSYRYGDLDFPGLLRRILERTKVPRLRFMTSHPKDLSRGLVDVMAGEPRVMPHIHLPLQSGSNRVLEKMGRRYTVERYFEVVEYIRSRLAYVSLTTDLIVGFPSETHEEFEQTLAVVSRVQYDSAFMFRYSVRPGTAAAQLVDDVPEEEKIARLNELIDRQQEISRERNQREVGRVCRAVVEGTSRRSDRLWRARTEGNKTVLFASNEVAIGQVVPVRIESADAFTLHGSPMREGE